MCPGEGEAVGSYGLAVLIVGTGIHTGLRKNQASSVTNKVLHARLVQKVVAFSFPVSGTF